MKDLKGITQDSRKVEPGFLFAALPGTKVDGRDFIEMAIEKGATYILAPVNTPQPAGEVILITDENPKKKLAEIVANFYGAQPENIVAVTGTNGKTSTAIFAQQFWEMAEKKAVSMGTVGIHGAGISREAAMTTPDPITLHHDLAELAKQGITHLAIEASSHGMDQYRLDGLHVKAAGFTNLSRDHLDYHPDMEDYLRAKLRLFTELLEKDGVAVLNADVPEFEGLKSKSTNSVSYGFQGEDYKIISATPTAHGQDLKLQIEGEVYDIHFPLVGEFQVMNALCALGLVSHDGSAKDYMQFFENLKGVPGRLQPVQGHPANAGIYVDYAHTPDALDNVLKAARPHTKNRLICITGCGGDRDKGKRPQMAAISSELADYTIITDDNPRSEEPAQIRKDMLVGIKSGEFEEIAGRREAINRAIVMLKEGDVLVIAGKGHEQGQTFVDRTDPFDDVQEAEKAIKSISKKNT